MKDQPPMRAMLSFDGHVVSMAQGGWRLSCPSTDLPKWINFHERMRDRANGKYAKFYVQPIAVLKAVHVRLAAKVAA